MIQTTIGSILVMIETIGFMVFKIIFITVTMKLIEAETFVSPNTNLFLRMKKSDYL